MSGPPTTTVTPLATYRNRTPYPFCPGCGHGPILDRLNEALVRRTLDPREVVLVSDIGCSGLSDQYFVTSAFHGLHGRSLTYAAGIKLARPELTVVVLIGDGGMGIGGAHLLAAARRNIGVTTLVFNNFNFGMTGGQHSTTTPEGALTSTTPGGSLERPLDLCATVAANGASYVWRGSSFDRDLADRIAEAIAHPGFALLDIWELCTAHFQPRNRWSRRSLEKTMESLGLATGLIRRETTPELAARYRELGARHRGGDVLPRTLLDTAYPSRLERRCGLVVAGSAGGRVGTAVRLAARAAVLSGLWAAQRGDYPVTVKSGHSIGELIVAPRPIDYAGLEQPDALAILSEDGWAKADRYLRRMDAGGRVFRVPSIPLADSPAPVVEIDPRRLPTAIARGQLALVAVASMARELDLLSREALLAAAELEPEGQRQAAAEAIEAGYAGAATPPGERLGQPAR